MLQHNIIKYCIQELCLSTPPSPKIRHMSQIEHAALQIQIAVFKRQLQIQSNNMNGSGSTPKHASLHHVVIVISLLQQPRPGLRRPDFYINPCVEYSHQVDRHPGKPSSSQPWHGPCMNIPSPTEMSEFWKLVSGKGYPSGSHWRKS
jgi:hypothetical protein